MKKSVSTALACALGAGIGGLVAIELAASFALIAGIIGALVGGAIAYCAVDFQQLCSGVARSYRTGACRITDTYRRAIVWRPYLPYWKATAITMLGFATFAASLTLLFLAVVICNDNYISDLKDPYIDILVAIFFFCLSVTLAGATVLFVGLALFTPWFNSESHWRWAHRYMSYEEYLFQDISDSWRLFKFGNPIVLPFVLLRLSVLVIYNVATYLWKNRARGVNGVISGVRFGAFVGKECLRFFVNAFVYVHSERRTICFVDAALGALIGFFFGSAVVGTIAGALLGFANYEIVSVRWLKIVPR